MKFQLSGKKTSDLPDWGARVCGGFHRWEFTPELPHWRNPSARGMAAQARIVALLLHHVMKGD